MCPWNSAILSCNFDSPVVTNMKILIWVADSNRAFKLKFMESLQVLDYPSYSLSIEVDFL